MRPGHPKTKKHLTKIVSQAGRAKPSALDAIWGPATNSPVLTREDKVRALDAHWSRVFIRKLFTKEAYDSIMDSYRETFPQNEWVLKNTHLKYLLDPFSVYSHLSHIPSDILWDCAQNILSRGSPPDDFNQETVRSSGWCD